MDHSDSRHLQAQQQTPYYAEQGGEAALFAHAFEQKLPVLIKGPTGCVAKPVLSSTWPPDWAARSSR